MTEAELTLLSPPPSICAECGQPSARLKLVGPIVVRITAPQGFERSRDVGAGILQLGMLCRLDGRGGRAQEAAQVEGQGVSVASPKSGVSSAGMRSKLVNAPPAAEDEFGPYSTERLLEMDQRFRERLERAISDGRERPLTALQAGRANVRA